MRDYSTKVIGSVTNADRLAWNACQAAACPFLTWNFLALLEACGAATEENGWTPAHVELSRGGRVAAYIPMYAIAGSSGSFFWDDGMEDVAEAAGRKWFPKLVGAVPFTPTPVWRPLVAPGQDEAETMVACFSAVADIAKSGGFSGVHLHWTDGAVGDALGKALGKAAPYPAAGERWMEWTRQVYRWENSGYKSFVEFTDSFSKNMRRNVARDRADVAAEGISVRLIRGDEAGPRIWELMADYYERTNNKFGDWAARFLPRRFFELASDYIGSQVRFAAAYKDDAAEPLALAMLFEGQGSLWGRYWGSAKDFPGLHFETCYYAPMEYAIRSGLSGFDPGMGGDHKARRGFSSRLASSYHRVFDARLARVYAMAIDEASLREAETVAALNDELPFRRFPAPGRGASGSVPGAFRRPS